jgi:hypothetical protein
VATAPRRLILVTRVALLFVLGAAGLGCDPTVMFACERHDDCVDGAAQGVCEPDGYCSFPDTDCESGRRYGEHAPATVAGDCTPVHEVDPGVLVGIAESSSDSTTAPLRTSGDDTTSSGSSDEGTSELPETTQGESSSDGAHDLDTGAETSSTGGDREPPDCNALDCAGCMDCVALPSAACEDELEACTNVNGCQSGVACMRECTLYGSCFDDCCPGDVGPLVDEFVLCTADHCIDACGEYEFLTCG